ncbi:MAG: hypothetical protein IT430_07070 [Phycisphaerales bacterium]|nr:hypothetical protein [Phycisphaerales bacterium]
MDGLPLGDWQFYVVTAAALGGIWLIVRPLLGRPGNSGCPNCADGAATSTRRRTTGLTVEGKRV